MGFRQLMEELFGMKKKPAVDATLYYAIGPQIQAGQPIPQQNQWNQPHWNQQSAVPQEQWGNPTQMMQPMMPDPVCHQPSPAQMSSNHEMMQPLNKHMDHFHEQQSRDLHVHNEMHHQMTHDHSIMHQNHIEHQDHSFQDHSFQNQSMQHNFDMHNTFHNPDPGFHNPGGGFGF